MTIVLQAVTRPVDEAFKSGTLVMPRGPVGTLPPERWSDCPVNSVLVIAAVLFFVLSLNSLLHAGRDIMRASAMGRENFRLEDSVPLVRSRNWCFAAAILPFCLIASKAEFINNNLYLSLDNVWKTPVTIGVFAVYLLVRYILYKTARPSRGNQETYRVAHRSAMNSFIPATIILFISSAMLVLLKADAQQSRSILLWILAGLYFTYIMVKAQIFNSSYGVLTTFLYLCALEFLPTAALIGAVLWI